MMQSSVTVSYLVALFNKERYIVECIDSLLADSSPGIEIEVSIVDDGSTDRSLEIVRASYGELNQVLIDAFSSNLGKNAAYNRAYENSGGDYISIIGADDFIPKGRTSVLLEECRKTGKPVYGHLSVFDDSSKKVVDVINNSVISYPEVLVRNTLSGGSCIFTKEHASAVFPIPTNLKFEDWWIAYNLVKKFGVKIVDSQVLYYRIHAENDVGAVQRDYEAVLRDYRRHFEYLDELSRTVDDAQGMRYLEKSRKMREAFFGNFSWAYFRLFPIDVTWIKTIYFALFGAKSYYFWLGKLRRGLLHLRKR